MNVKWIMLILCLVVFITVNEAKKQEKKPKLKNEVEKSESRGKETKSSKLHYKEEKKNFNGKQKEKNKKYEKSNAQIKNKDSKPKERKKREIKPVEKSNLEASDMKNSKANKNTLFREGQPEFESQNGERKFSKNKKAKEKEAKQNIESENDAKSAPIESPKAVPADSAKKQIKEEPAVDMEIQVEQIE